MLILLVSQSHSLEAALVEPLTSTLVSDHDVPRTVAVQVMEWFGDIRDGRWKVNLQGIMKQIGLTTLQSHKASISLSIFSLLSAAFRTIPSLSMIF